MNASNFKFYRSAFYKKIQGEDKIFIDNKHEEDLQRRKEARDKLKRYSERVKNDYYPAID